MQYFNEHNTKWESDTNEYGINETYLVYCGSLEELAEETGESEDKLIELLGEYEDDSRELIEHNHEIAIAREGRY